VLGTLADLLLPTACAGCDATSVPLSSGVCPKCVEVMVNLVPHVTRPTPAPAGLPPCHALGAYADPLRSLVLAYKDRGRHGLARPLGNLLAAVVASAIEVSGRSAYRCC